MPYATIAHALEDGSARWRAPEDLFPPGLDIERELDLGRRVFESSHSGQMKALEEGGSSMYSIYTNGTADHGAGGVYKSVSGLNGAYRHSNNSAVSRTPEPSSDIWSLGMLALELFSERAPYASWACDEAAVMELARGRVPAHPRDSGSSPPLGDRCETSGREREFEGAVPEHIWQLSQRCWARDPVKRPSAREVKKGLRGDVDPKVLWGAEGSDLRTVDGAGGGEKGRRSESHARSGMWMWGSMRNRMRCVLLIRSVF